jgi:hypothetical protein
MDRRLVIAKTLLLLLPLLLATPGKAYGYADPGTGAFLYQAAYAAFLGGSFYLRRVLDRLFQRHKQSVSAGLVMPTGAREPGVSERVL